MAISWFGSTCVSGHATKGSSGSLYVVLLTMKLLFMMTFVFM